MARSDGNRIKRQRHLAGRHVSAPPRQLSHFQHDAAADLAFEDLPGKRLGFLPGVRLRHGGEFAAIEVFREPRPSLKAFCFWSHHRINARRASRREV